MTPSGVECHRSRPPQDPQPLKLPNSWVLDEVMIGSFSKNVDANYNGKYCRTPDEKLNPMCQKQHEKFKRDGVVTWRMIYVTTLTPGTQPRFLLLPDHSLSPKTCVSGNHAFKLIETGSIKSTNGKIFKAYSVVLAF
ncbi:hypothetical protein N7540_007729 [Penicillium herquei]|nr:hypothetical protein N7540_007729 [Penicillium herquei]